MSRQDRFETLMRHARVQQSIGDRPDYWMGYQRGLRRAFQGESDGTDEENALLSTLAERPDHTHRERSEGYLAGLAALDERETPPLPTAQSVRAFLKRHGITGAKAARMMYLSDSRQVRKYTGGASPRQLDGARWFALHAHVMLTPEQLAEIHAAMDANAMTDDDDPLADDTET
jgi:hypothetical protein